jgi:hypothetical protein
MDRGEQEKNFGLHFDGDKENSMNKAYQLEATCLTCKGEAYVLAQPDLVDKYQQGELVQNVWPDASTEYREVIIGWRTGAYICPMCALDDE